MPSIAWPWAIVLCGFNDVEAAPQPREYYEALYPRAGTGGLSCELIAPTAEGRMHGAHRGRTRITG